MKLRIPLEEIWETFEKIKNEIEGEKTWLTRKITYDHVDCYFVFVKKQNKVFFSVRETNAIKEELESKYKLFFKNWNEDDFLFIEMNNPETGYDILHCIEDVIHAS